MTLPWHVVFNNIVHGSIFSQAHSIEAVTTTLVWVPVWAWSLVAHLNYITKEWKLLHRMLRIGPIRTITIRSFSLPLTLLLSLLVNLFTSWVDYLNCGIKILYWSNVFLLIFSLWVFLLAYMVCILVRFKLNRLFCINFICFLLVRPKRSILNLYKISLLTVFLFNLWIVLGFSFQIWSTQWRKVIGSLSFQKSLLSFHDQFFRLII